MSASTLRDADARRTVACVHCGLPTAISIEEFDPATSGPVFCCAGCRGAYDLIHGWGLEAFYDLRDHGPDYQHIDIGERQFRIHAEVLVPE